MKLKPTNLFLIYSSLPLPQSDLAEAVSSSGGGVSVRLPSATEKIVTENDKLRKEIKKVLYSFIHLWLGLHVNEANK